MADAQHKVTQPSALSVMALDRKGRLTPRDLEELTRLCRGWAQSGLLPKGMTEDNGRPLPPDVVVKRVMIASQMLQTLGLPWQTNLRFVAMVRGTPSLFGDAPLALVERSGLLCGRLDEYLVTEEYERVCLENRNLNAPLFAAVCVGRRTGGDAVGRTFSMQQAQAAGLLGNSRSAWSGYPHRMLQLRARGLLLKDVFPDVLSGIGIAEYDGDADLMPEAIGLSAAHASVQASFAEEPEERRDNVLSDAFSDDDIDDAPDAADAAGEAP